MFDVMRKGGEENERTRSGLAGRVGSCIGLARRLRNWREHCKGGEDLWAGILPGLS